MLYKPKSCDSLNVQVTSVQFSSLKPYTVAHEVHIHPCKLQLLHRSEVNVKMKKIRITYPHCRRRFNENKNHPTISASNAWVWPKKNPCFTFSGTGLSRPWARIPDLHVFLDPQRVCFKNWQLKSWVWHWDHRVRRNFWVLIFTNWIYIFTGVVCSNYITLAVTRYSCTRVIAITVHRSETCVFYCCNP